MYGPPDGEPGLESRDAGNIYYLHCTPLVLISWVGMGYPCLRSTIRYYLLVHPLSNYVCPPIQLQHTDEHTDSSWHYPLSSAVPPSSSPSMVYTTTSPNHILPPHTRHPDPKQAPGTWSDWFSRVFFIIKNTTWLDRDLLHLPVLTMATPTGKYSVNWRSLNIFRDW